MTEKIFADVMGAVMLEENYIRVPVINMAELNENCQELSIKVINTLETTGFLGISNIPKFNFKKLKMYCEWFFKQSQEAKDGLLRHTQRAENKNVYRGYFTMSENKYSKQEGFEFGKDVEENTGNWFYETSVWPPETDVDIGFKSFMLDIYDQMHDLAMTILRLAAIGLGISENSFEHLFNDKPCSSFRLFHYLSYGKLIPEKPITEDETVISVGDHTDSNFLTLLHTFDYPGLQILTQNGEWHSVEPLPDGLIMNIGDVFSRIMDGRFKATRHRVVDIGVDRYSVPFFLEPKYDGDISEHFMSKVTSDNRNHAVEYYGSWVSEIRRLKQFPEYVTLPNK